MKKFILEKSYNNTYVELIKFFTNKTISFFKPKMIILAVVATLCAGMAFSIPFLAAATIMQGIIGGVLGALITAGSIGYAKKCKYDYEECNKINEYLDKFEYEKVFDNYINNRSMLLHRIAGSMENYLEEEKIYGVKSPREREEEELHPETSIGAVAQSIRNYEEYGKLQEPPKAKFTLIDRKSNGNDKEIER